MTILKGKDVVDNMVEDLKSSVQSLDDAAPCLAIIRVGNRPDDLAYERGAIKRMTPLGIICRVIELPADVSQDDYVKCFTELNNDDSVDGILPLRPLPPHLDSSIIENLIKPEKDVDGISPLNTAKMYLGDKRAFAPCTAEAVMEIIDNMHYDLQGKKVVIVGCGNVVGKPLSLLMFQRNATVTVCNEYTKELVSECNDADVLVAAAGVRKLIKAEHVSPDCIVIDVGINTDENGKLCGDVDFEEVASRVKGITPVPGGVGAVTTYVLAKHVIKAAEDKKLK